MQRFIEPNNRRRNFWRRNFRRQNSGDEISGDEISGDEISDDEISDDEISDDEISGNRFWIDTNPGFQFFHVTGYLDMGNNFAKFRQGGSVVIIILKNMDIHRVLAKSLAWSYRLHHILWWFSKRFLSSTAVLRSNCTIIFLGQFNCEFSWNFLILLIVFIKFFERKFKKVMYRKTIANTLIISEPYKVTSAFNTFSQKWRHQMLIILRPECSKWRQFIPNFIFNAFLSHRSEVRIEESIAWNISRLASNLWKLFFKTVQKDVIWRTPAIAWRGFLLKRPFDVHFHN